MALVAVLSLLTAALAASAWGGVAMFDALARLVREAGRPSLYPV